MRCHVEVKGVRVGPTFNHWDEAVTYGERHLSDADNWYVCPELPARDPLPVYFGDTTFRAAGLDDYGNPF